MQRGGSRFVDGIHIGGPMEHELLAHFEAVVEGAVVEWRPRVRVLFVGVVAEIEEVAHTQVVAFISGLVQWILRLPELAR